MVCTEIEVDEKKIKNQTNCIPKCRGSPKKNVGKGCPYFIDE